MLMRVGLGPRDQTGDDNPEGTLCGPATELHRWEERKGGREP